MKIVTNWFLTKLLFGATLFFAAGADVLGAAEGAGDGTQGLDDGGLDSSADGADAETGADGGDGQRSADESADAGDDEPREAARRPEDKEDLKDFHGTASARVRGLLKASPRLAEIFKESPQVQQVIEAAFRRDAAYRDAFPTVAEANQFRERFPNGLADVQALEADVAEVQELDKDFYTRDREGNFPGHTKIIGNMFQDDREAAVSLFRSLPKEWARLDPESYREVMGQIIGATFRAREIPEFLNDLIADAKEAKQDGLAQGLAKLATWVNGFNAEKPRPTPEQEQIRRERADLKRQTDERTRQDAQNFHRSFVGESKKLQTGIIKGHPAIKKLLEAKSVSDEKKAQIIEQVRISMEKLLGKSTSFMKKLRPAYNARNLQEVTSLQKAAWSQAWLLNRMVRQVLNKETPQMVQNSREAVRRRAGAGPARNTPDKSGERKNAPLGTLPAKQIGGVWYRDGGRGAKFSSQEILAGKHLST